MQLRLASAIGGGLLAALVLTACGSDPQGSIPAPNIATVTGAGRDVQVPSDIERTDYPNACRLLPDDTVATLLESPASANRYFGGCSWSTGLASFPSLQVAWVQLGSQADSRYDDSVGKVTGLRELSDIGDRARTYRVDNPKSDNKTIYVDVLKSDVYFEVSVGIVTSSATVLTSSEAIAMRVAQLVARQVS